MNKMAKVTAKLRYLRIAPRKVRLVADLIRGKNLEQAKTILSFTIKKSAAPLLKLLKQAEANAKNNFQLEPDNLFISKITVDEGPKFKRWEPRWRGQAYEIQKKTSHVALILDEREKKKAKVKKVKAKAVLKPGAIKPVVKKEKKEEEIVAWEEKPKKEKAFQKRPKIKEEVKIKKPRARGGLARFFRRKSV